jgi:predicted nucleotide-binding protein (sugar kinase/HSP70/actin superfamily)
LRETIGFPRALLFYYYYPAWRAFFESLGQICVVSGETTKAVIDSGIKVTVDEACLPVKAFHGHALSLSDTCDRVFVPRLVSVEKKAYICPKLMGLPDMVRQNCSGIRRILDPCIDMSRNSRAYKREVYATGRLFTGNGRKIHAARERAKQTYQAFAKLLQAGLAPIDAMTRLDLLDTPGDNGSRSSLGISTPAKAENNRPLVIGLLGHPYIIYDSFLGMNVMERLRLMGAHVVTMDMLSPQVIEQEAAKSKKRVFWTIGRKLLGAGYYFLKPGIVDGCLLMSSFACGPDAFIGEFLQQESIRSERQVPFMTITVDEHTGEAGVLTRLEAFIDISERSMSR